MHNQTRAQLRLQTYWGSATFPGVDMQVIELPTVLRDLMEMEPDEVRKVLNQVRALKGQLETFETLLSMVGTIAQGSASEPLENGDHRPQPKTLREGIVAVLSDGRARRPAEVFRALEERAWAPTGAGARSQVSNRLRDMISKGEAIQLDDGRYQLALAPGNDEAG